MSYLPESALNPSSRSPVCRFPLELLHIIFDITRRDPPSAMPFTLSQVCHGWRSFLLASPLLWTTILMERLPLPNLKYYELWLERSQYLDLSLQIQSSSLHWTEKNLETLAQVIIALGSYCREIEVTRIFSPLDMGFRAIRILLGLGQFPKLTKLRLPLIDMPHVPESKLGLSPMPNLESLVIPGSQFCLSPEWFSTCGRLRRMHLIYDDLLVPSAILPFLYRTIESISAQLEDLTIHVPGHGDLLQQMGFGGVQLDIVEMPKDIIWLPRLTKLSLSWGKDNYEGHSFCGLFRLLRTPKLLALPHLWVSELGKEKILDRHPLLECLGIIGPPYYEPAASQVILSSFNAVQLESLRSVRFGFIKWQDGEFATALLQSCPRLVYVRLHQCSFVREADLRRLVEGREASEELATLDYLGVLNCKALELNEAALAWFGGRLETFEYVL